MNASRLSTWRRWLALLVTSQVACGLTVTGSAVFGEGADAGVDGASPGDAGPGELPDAGGPGSVEQEAGCPAVCSGGCGGGTCVVRNSGRSVICPAGFACRAECTSFQVCGSVDCGAASACEVLCLASQACDSMTVACGAGPCSIVCADGQGCNSLTIRPATAASLCLECQGSDGCNSVECAGGQAATKSCAGDHCGDVGGCGTFAAATTCR